MNDDFTEWYYTRCAGSAHKRKTQHYRKALEQQVNHCLVTWEGNFTELIIFPVSGRAVFYDLVQGVISHCRRDVT
jgi:hypothetical protein